MLILPAVSSNNIVVPVFDPTRSFPDAESKCDVEIGCSPVVKV